MILDIIEVTNPGSRNSKNVTVNINSNIRHILFLKFGPTNWFNNLIGFNDHQNLPCGSGKNGS